MAWRSPNATPPGGFVIFQQYPQALADLGEEIEPLYTHPPRREWQSLTNEELNRIESQAQAQDKLNLSFLFLEIQQALKEKNNG